jgi:hypothetical protein
MACPKRGSQTTYLYDEADEDEEVDPHPGGYWCVVCGRFLPVDGGLIVHDKIPHPESMNFSEDDRPQ